MQEPLYYIDRQTGKKTEEQVYGGNALEFLYGESFLSRTLGRFLSTLCSKISLCSAVYGWWQKQSWSKKKIIPFINKYHVDTTDFLNPPESYESFNAFFTRHLKPDARPSASTPAIIPADGRYRVFQDIATVDGFLVKGKKFKLDELLQDKSLAKEYAHAGMVMARLCPVDYHRFHFPCDCIPAKAELINGWLYSVNPIAVKHNIDIFSENKRMLTVLETTDFGKVLFMEIGATNVGTIHQTYTPNKSYQKGEEKGYFSFGGSALIILFPQNSIRFNDDLIKSTSDGIETLCRLGQPLGNLY